MPNVPSNPTKATPEEFVGDLVRITGYRCLALHIVRTKMTFEQYLDQLTRRGGWDVTVVWGDGKRSLMKGLPGRTREDDKRLWSYIEGYSDDPTSRVLPANVGHYEVIPFEASTTHA